MKTITIRELHARTGRWVREAAQHGQILVTDGLCIVVVFWPFAGTQGVLAVFAVYFVIYILRLNAAIDKRVAKRKQQ